jgi:transcriptional regulator with XRE-family HTH domain
MPKPREKPPLTPELGALGLAVEKVREERGDTQESVGEKRFSSHHLTGPIERGHRNPTFMTLVKVAEALDSSPSEIVSLADRYLQEGKVGRLGEPPR